MSDMNDTPVRPRRYLVPGEGVVEVEAADGDTAYALVEAWVRGTGQQAQEAIRDETGVVRVRWLRPEPESEAFPGGRTRSLKA